MRYYAEPDGGAKHDLSKKLLHLLKNWPASAALSWGNLHGHRQQHWTTFRKLRCGAVHDVAAEVRHLESVER